MPGSTLVGGEVRDAGDVRAGLGDAALLHAHPHELNRSRGHQGKRNAGVDIDSTTAEESTSVPSMSHRTASARARGAGSSVELPDDDNS